MSYDSVACTVSCFLKQIARLEGPPAKRSDDRGSNCCVRVRVVHAPGDASVFTYQQSEPGRPETATITIQRGDVEQQVSKQELLTMIGL